MVTFTVTATINSDIPMEPFARRGDKVVMIQERDYISTVRHVLTGKVFNVNNTDLTKDTPTDFL